MFESILHSVSFSNFNSWIYGRFINLHSNLPYKEGRLMDANKEGRSNDFRIFLWNLKE